MLLITHVSVPYGITCIVSSLSCCIKLYHVLGYRDLSSEEEEPRDNDSDGSLSTEYGSPETKLNRSIGK